MVTSYSYYLVFCPHPPLLVSRLCSIISGALWTDDLSLLQHVAPICKSLNSRLVCRRVSDGLGTFPPGGILYRGCAITDQELNFYRVAGQKFRIPAYFSTSFKENTARAFLRRAWTYHNDNGATKPGVLLKIQVDPRGKDDPAWLCKNVNLVKSRMRYHHGATTTEIPDEFEYLFTQYSVFTVAKFVESPSPNYRTPHVLYLRAADDNALEPPGLLLAPRV